MVPVLFTAHMNQVCDYRRRAGISQAYAVRGETSKNKGNCGYGRKLVAKFKHTSTMFARKENLSKHVSNPFFKNFEPITTNMFEV